MNRRELIIGCAAMPVLSAAGAAFADTDPALVAAIAGPQRDPRNRVRDPFRHPAETLTFWGLKPGMTVVEVSPSGGYWTEILAPYLHATKGVYVGAIGGDPAPFKARYADPTLWGDIRTAPFDAAAGPIAAPGTADLLFTARNIHDWMWTPGRLDGALATFHAALRAGGILGVEEHRADPRPMVADARDGYVATAWLTGAVEKAGFRLEASSEVNANPRDTKEYPFGVWTLPPTRRTHAKDQPTPAGFDPARYEAIGESDRMTLRFRRI